MRFVRGLRDVLISVAGVAVVACGSTGPEGGPSPNFVRLQSDAGDYIGGGQTYNYTQANAVLAVTVAGGLLTVRITGDEQWSGRFQSPNTLTQLQPGEYTGLERYPFNDPVKGGLDWFGDGRGCNTLSGWFAVDSVTYDNNGALTTVDLRFEQHCEVATAALHGTIHWRSDDLTRPPGPVNPVPAGLWRPAPGSTPSTGNYVYLTSEFGDFIGQGETHIYTPANAAITGTSVGSHLSISVAGAQAWTGEYQVMNSITRLETGYYADLRRYPFHNPAKGGLSWYGEGRGCNTLVGWFAVDRVTYTGDSLTAIDLRFEQRCEGGTAALHGAIHLGG
jgi:hypothetical protein